MEVNVVEEAGEVVVEVEGGGKAGGESEGGGLGSVCGP